MALYAGTTTNQDAYKPHEVHPREQHHVDYTYNPTPFEGSTESHDAFKQWQLEKRAAPPSPPMRISLPFEGESLVPGAGMCPKHVAQQSFMWLKW